MNTPKTAEPKQPKKIWVSLKEISVRFVAKLQTDEVFLKKFIVTAITIDLIGMGIISWLM